MQNPLKVFFGYSCSLQITLFVSGIFFSTVALAQPCDPPHLPTLFGGDPTAVYCKDQIVFFGVNNTDDQQIYDFSIYRNGVATRKKKGGPLTGNGSTLSVAAIMRSVQDAGEYRITIYNKCGDSASFSFYTFSSNIDNLAISSWGSDAVTARWSASGPKPAIIYEYAVTTEPDPNSLYIYYKTTTDTVITETGLTPGLDYYIYVRMKEATLNGDPVRNYIGAGSCPGENNAWQTLKFTSCSGAATIGSVSPANVVKCSGSTVTLTASGGSTYQWFDSNDNPIPGATSPTYTTATAGQYKTYITTAAGCAGTVYNAIILDTVLHTCDFFGGGTYCTGDSVRMGIFNTNASQAYTILKDGVPVYTVPGVGQDEMETGSFAYKSEDTLWYKFKITSAAQTGTYSIRTTNAWCTTALTFGTMPVATPAGNTVTGITTANITDRSVNFSWSFAAGWVNKFEYAVTTSATPPASGTITTNLFAFADALNPSTTYRIHIRPVCSQGALSWTTMSFTTLASYTACTSATPAISACTFTTRYIPSGTGTWDFGAGTYPINSDGASTPGKERVFSFTPSQGGVYYLDVTATNGATVDYLYKSGTVCNATGWTGIRAITDPGKYPIGMLQSGTQYLFVMDNENSAVAASQTFRICRAAVAIPQVVNDCVAIVPIPYIPAFSPKEEFIIDIYGNLVASIDGSSTGFDQYDINGSYYVNTQSIRRDLYKRECLDRNFYLNVSNAKVKLFFADADLQRLINEPDDGIGDITTITDLNASSDVGDCAFLPFNATLSLQSNHGDYDAGSHYVLFQNANGITYFLHGGNTALNYSKEPPYTENFDQVTFPAGWTQQLVAPGDDGLMGNILFVPTSSNPTTVPFSGADFVKWDSWDYHNGAETRLISPPIRIGNGGDKNLKVEFYWYNENTSPWDNGNYLTEGVQVQYSVNGTDWTDLGAFIPRHDATLTQGTGLWKKKTLAVPQLPDAPIVFIAFKFHSAYGDNCSMDAASFTWAAGCTGTVSGLSVSSSTSNTINFGWNTVPGVVDYQYSVVGGFDNINGTAFGTNATANYLTGSTSYQIQVRPECSAGVFGDWTTIQATTPAGPSFCLVTPTIQACTIQNTTIPAGQGQWDFTGAYPNNSDGWSTYGKEQIFSFTPTETGVYYIDILPASGLGYVDYFYKAAASGCNNKGWIGIDDVYYTGKLAIGWLDAGVTYLILLDNESDAAITKSFRVCKANILTPPANACTETYWLPNGLPPNSSKTEYFIDENGNLIAGINSLHHGNITPGAGVSYYVNNGPVRRDAGNREYLDRNFTFKTTLELPTNQTGVTLFFSAAELQRLIDEPDDGIADVESASDLHVTRIVQSNCSATVPSGLSALYPFAADQYDDNTFYIGAGGEALGTYFIHGGYAPLEGEQNVTCPTSDIAFSYDISYLYPNSRSYQWQVDKGSGFENISNDAIYSGATTSYLSLNHPPTSFNGYKYRCFSIVPGNFNTDLDTLISSPKTLKFIVTWNGSLSDDWENAGNWDCGMMPDANTDVIIKDNAFFWPVIYHNVSCRSIIANPNTTITVSPGVKLTLTGH